MLKPTHKYFSQVQFQMGVTGRKWCDFVIYTKEDIFVQRVSFDELCWEKLSIACQIFFRQHICPKLLQQE